MGENSDPARRRRLQLAREEVIRRALDYGRAVKALAKEGAAQSVVTREARDRLLEVAIQLAVVVDGQAKQ